MIAQSDTVVITLPFLLWDLISKLAHREFQIKDEHWLQVKRLAALIYYIYVSGIVFLWFMKGLSIFKAENFFCLVGALISVLLVQIGKFVFVLVCGISLGFINY